MGRGRCRCEVERQTTIEPWTMPALRPIGGALTLTSDEVITRGEDANRPRNRPTL